MSNFEHISRDADPAAATKYVDVAADDAQSTALQPALNPSFSKLTKIKFEDRKLKKIRRAFLTRP